MNIKTPLIFFCFYTCLTVQTTMAEVPETRIQALFLYKFIENTNWPGGNGDLTVGFLGETPVQAEFEKMLKSRKSTNISVLKTDLSSILKCDVVFLPVSQSTQFTPLIESIKNNSILIITEDDGLIKEGAGISFIKSGESLSFIINRSSMDKRKLQVSGSLLSLGKQI